MRGSPAKLEKKARVLPRPQPVTIGHKSMTKVEGHFTSDFERVLNEQSADLTVFRLMLKTMLVSIFRNVPDRAELVADLRRKSLAAIDRASICAQLPAADEMQKQLTLMRGEMFFQELETALGLACDRSGSAGSN
jgi:hypothetical protein